MQHSRSSPFKSLPSDGDWARGPATRRGRVSAQLFPLSGWEARAAHAQSTLGGLGPAGPPLVAYCKGEFQFLRNGISTPRLLDQPRRGDVRKAMGLQAWQLCLACASLISEGSEFSKLSPYPCFVESGCPRRARFVTACTMMNCHVRLGDSPKERTCSKGHFFYGSTRLGWRAGRMSCDSTLHVSTALLSHGSTGLG